MNSQRHAPEFKDEAVRQALERGYSVAEVSARVGVSAHSLYEWVKALKPDGSERSIRVNGVEAISLHTSPVPPNSGNSISSKSLKLQAPALASRSNREFW